MSMTTEEARKMLLRAAKGGKHYYQIIFDVDAKGNITIYGGRDTTDDGMQRHFLIWGHEPDDYIWLYRGKNGEDYGSDFMKRRRDARAKITDEDIVKAYLQYRATNPEEIDEYGGILPPIRADYKAIDAEQRRRNRAYIKEFYGEDIPIDYDFNAQYDKYLSSK